MPTAPPRSRPPHPSVRPTPGASTGGVVLATLVYTVLALAIFRPLARLATAYIGDGGDHWMFAWNGWWVGYALTHGRNPLYCDLQLAPYGAPLVYHTLALPASLLMAALRPLLDAVLAFNTVIIGLYVFAGTAMFALAARVLRCTSAALVAGAVFMLCPFMASKALGHVNLLCAGLIPLFTLCLLAAVEDRRPGPRRRLAAVLGVTIATDLPLTAFCANVALWCWLWRSWRGNWRIETLRFWRALLPAGLVAAGFGLVIAGYSVAYGVRPEMRSGVAHVPEPLSFLLPLHSTSVWAPRFAAAFDWRLGNLELAVYLGWAVLPLAVAGWWFSRADPRVRWTLWFFIAAVSLSCGPKLLWEREIVRVAGWQVRLPFSIYRYLPVVGSVGQTGRYMAIGYMAQAIGVGALLVAVRRRCGRRWGAAAVTGVATLVISDFLFVPVLTPAPPQPIAPGPGRVLDARLNAWHSGIGLYYQMRHERPLVGGYIARIPVPVLQDYAASPVLRWLFELSKAAAGQPPPCPELAAQLAALDVRCVTVNPASPQQQWLESCGWRLIHSDEWGATLTIEPAP